MTSPERAGPPSGQPDGPHGDPEGEQPGQHDQKLSTNGFAIAALVCGVIGAFPLAMIFAVIALKRIKDRHQRGRGMAIAGLVLSAVWVVIIAIGVLLESGKDNDPIRAIRILVGECIEQSPADMEHVLDLPKVPCDQPHEGEVYATLPVDSDDLPEISVLDSEYGSRCLPALGHYSSRAVADPDVHVAVLYPTQDTWDHGDRDVVCIAVTSAKRSGSVK